VVGRTRAVGGRRYRPGRSPRQERTADPRDVLELLGRGSASGATGDRASEAPCDPAAGLVHRERLPERPGEPVALPDDLPTVLRERLATQGITALWSHQVEVLARARRGEHVVVATGTASGKSLAYQLPALERLLADDRSAVLYLAPTKALAHDQLRTLRQLRLPGLRAAVLDGDTPSAERDAVRRTANWVLTNPDLLHHSLLPNHAWWADLLHRLAVVVVDEAHVARGVFGGHVALVLRRLRRLAERYGADPTVLLASATVGNPAEHASALTGLPVVAVTRDGSPRGPLDVGLWLPPLEDEDGLGDPLAGAAATVAAVGAIDPGRLGAAAVAPDELAAGELAEQEDAGGDAGGAAASSGRRRSLLRETGDLLASFVAAGVQTLAFTRSRKGAELVALIARERLGDATGLAAGDGPPRRLADGVAAYRGGYLAEERRQLEAELRTGGVRGLAATEALELGIDVAGLDAVLLAGWPGTTAAFWQRLGRAGRAGGAAVGMLIAQEDPLDHYLVTHPDELLTRPPEDAIVDPANPYLLGPHLRCACQEVPLTAEEGTAWFGPSAPALLDRDVAAGRLRRRKGRHHWISRQRASAEVDLRGSGGATIRIVDTGTGALIGDVDEARAHRQVHAGAVYLHQGRTYRVAELDLDRHLALVEPVGRLTVTTRPSTTTDVVVLEVLAATDWAEVAVRLGRVEVTTQVVGYEVLRLGSDEVLERVDLDLPPVQLATVAVWYAVPERVLDRAGLDPRRVPGALHAAEHAAIGMLPLLALCDRWDLGGLSTARHPDTDRPTVFVYDGVPGGAGLAERSYHRLAEHLRLTRETIATCGCRTGCPSCVQSPKCGNGNEPLDKAGAVQLLDLLLARAPAEG
jgi:DEAD/DEAH box helicase domain-containing protein